jgi:hypothetical protein
MCSRKTKAVNFLLNIMIFLVINILLIAGLCYMNFPNHTFETFCWTILLVGDATFILVMSDIFKTIYKK